MVQPVAPTPPPEPAAARVAFRVTGTVQGVGFRPTVHGHAHRLAVRSALVGFCIEHDLRSPGVLFLNLI